MSGRPVPSQLDQVLPRFYVQKAGPYHPFGRIRIAPFGKGGLRILAESGYMIIDRRTANPIARLRPIPDTDRFELFYWSNVKGRWTTFGNLGRMKLVLKSAHEIVENDPMFRIAPGRRTR